MRRIRYLGLFLVVFVLSGCYNYRELNDLGIVTAISIDFRDGMFEVNNQVINPVKEQDASSSGEPTFVTFPSKGATLQEAFRMVILDCPRQLYASQLQLLVLSETVATEHLDEVLDFFVRDPETRAEFKIIIAQDDKDLEGIMIQTILDNLSSSNILESLEVQTKILGMSPSPTLNDLTNMYLNPYEEVVLPSMIIEGNIDEGEEEDNVTTTKAKATTRIAPSALFKGDDLVGYLDTDYSKFLSLIRGDMKTTIVNVEYGDGMVVFEPNRLKSQVSANVRDNKVNVSVSGFARLKEVVAMVDTTDIREIKKLEKALNGYLEKRILDTFEYIRKEYDADVFGFQNLYYKTDCKYFKEHYLDWYVNGFPELKFEVKVDIKLYEKGNSLGGIGYERDS